MTKLDKVECPHGLEVILTVGRDSGQYPKRRCSTYFSEFRNTGGDSEAMALERRRNSTFISVVSSSEPPEYVDDIDIDNIIHPSTLPNHLQACVSIIQPVGHERKLLSLVFNICALDISHTLVLSPTSQSDYDYAPDRVTIFGLDRAIRKGVLAGKEGDHPVYIDIFAHKCHSEFSSRVVYTCGTEAYAEEIDPGLGSASFSL
ncbi:hypothetical protein BDZ97DRAFT_1762466 [Flammula alnicola]|nr:hypothetical protein BDZ97DRAFT_1762466 [Flammula alnicola]